MPKSESRSKKMIGNTNAVKACHRAARTVISLSLTADRKSSLRSAILRKEGYAADDARVKEKARELAYLSWQAYAVID